MDLTLLLVTSYVYLNAQKKGFTNIRAMWWIGAGVERGLEWLWLDFTELAVNST